MEAFKVTNLLPLRSQQRPSLVKTWYSSLVNWNIQLWKTRTWSLKVHEERCVHSWVIWSTYPIWVKDYHNFWNVWHYIILQEWSVGLITLPNNFKTILDKTEEAKVKRVEMDDNNNTEDGTKIGLEVPKIFHFSYILCLSHVQVVCVGLSRTGTSSLKAALSQLLPGR